ncbi:unnamed protein product [Lathyrus oleraceus]|uniref:GH18 domain-containing protein n=1 Tax=Pisum sativum TaxID=3888 RepID=A0A9D5GZ08_PEA|nr:chitinase 2-like [Pisum sativum]KAI5446162.1 hypothetical protein KIW84_014133 [Pisum sativum]
MSGSTIVTPTIFREYIGMGDYIDHFPDEMINADIKEFHFILCFATETHVDGKGTGLFDRNWSFTSFSPEKVAELKKKLKNVKVVISIGGNGPEDTFNPKNNEDWIVNATSSIKGIILNYQTKLPNDDVLYGIDGIDINYEKISSSISDFSNCIGEVIKQLKVDPDVSKFMKVVSIAPTEGSQSYYLKLYRDNKGYIDWIDYKFYNQYFNTVEDFEKLFKILVTEYGTALDKFLVGVSTYEAIKSKTIIEGCEYLLNRRSLVGVFVWDAKPSAPAYTPEREIQKLLAKK